MIPGIEAFMRRRDSSVPVSPNVPQTEGTGNTNRSAVSPMSPLSPEKNTSSTDEAVEKNFNATLIQGGEPEEEASDWWATLRARIDLCDALIHQLCDLRGDDHGRRADLLAIRRRMAPARLDEDIEDLRTEILLLQRQIAMINEFKAAMGQRGKGSVV